MSLQSLGYRVTSFSNSLDALEAFKVEPDRFDLLITDLTMPKITGLELAEKVFEINPDMPVILCTGFSELVSKEKAEALGIKDFLLKPVLRKELSNAIRRIFDENL